MKIRLRIMSLAMAMISVAVANADQRGEEEFLSLKQIEQSVTARACLIGEPPGSPEPSVGDQWSQNYVILLENSHRGWFRRPDSWIQRQHVAMFFIRQKNDLHFFCADGLIGLDEQCGSGNWTGPWSRCALSMMQRETTPIALSKLNREGLFRHARKDYCGHLELKFTGDDPDSGGRWYTCVVTPGDGRPPYTLEQQ